MGEPALLGPAEIRELAARLGLRPTKRLGQNFLHDANTIRRIVRTAGLSAGEHVLEVGPGLGSLTLGLLGVAASVTAVEIDPVLAAALPDTIEARGGADRLRVVTADALRLPPLPPPAPTALVANLPYNVAVPVVLTLLQQLPSIAHGLVLVQAEVAERLAAGAGEPAYGVPSVKLAWYAAATRAGAVGRSVFWPQPNVESGLVRLVRRPPPELPPGVRRGDVFDAVDAAFAQRRKMLRSALAGWAGSPAAAQSVLQRAGIDPTRRGETLGLDAYVALATVRGATDRQP